MAGDSVFVTLSGPGGPLSDNCKVSSIPGFNCDFPKLLAAGTYTVRVDPQGTNATALALTLSSDLGGTLTLNAAASTFTTTRVGQNGRYTFAGTVGQNVTLLWTGSTIPGTWSFISVYKPDGSSLNGGAAFGVGSNDTGALDLPICPLRALTLSSSIHSAQAWGRSTSKSRVKLPARSHRRGDNEVSLAPGRNGRYTSPAPQGTPRPGRFRACHHPRRRFCCDYLFRAGWTT